MLKTKRLSDLYSFPPFRPATIVQGIFGDPRAVVVRMFRRQKKLRAAFVRLLTVAFMIRRFVAFAIYPVETNGYTSRLIFAVLTAGNVVR